MIYIKKHATPQGLLLAMCDEELLGKVFASGKMQLDLDKYADFYRGELVAEAQASDGTSGEDIYSANIVGERAVAVMLNRGMVKKADVKMVGRVPFVQIFKMDL